MTISFKAVVVSNHRRKDGTWPVKIRVYFNGGMRRLPTNLVCRKDDLTRSYHIKNPMIIEKANDLIRRMREPLTGLTFFDLEGKDVDWVVDRIRRHIAGENFQLDFFGFSETFMAGRKPETAKAYRTAVNAFRDFVGDRLDINDISRKMLLDFQDAFVSSGKSKLAASRYITALSTIYNAAKLRYNDEDAGSIRIPRSPFSGIEKVKVVPQGQPNLGVEMMQKMISSEAVAQTRTALDIFILSFCLMGANLADLYEAESFEGDVWVYNRRKTRDGRADKALMKVTIPPEARPFLDRLKGTGKWWLNGLRSYATNLHCVGMKVNTYLGKWCEENGVERFTFYAARHTWASLARKAGVDKSTIDDCLAHVGDYTITDIYAERSWDLMTEANRKVLAMFEW